MNGGAETLALAIAENAARDRHVTVDSGIIIIAAASRRQECDLRYSVYFLLCVYLDACRERFYG